MRLKYCSGLFFICLLLSIGFSGCLKDDEYNKGTIQSARSRGAQNVVSLGLTATSNENHIQLAFENVDKDTTFDMVPVILSSSEPAPVDINVTLSLDPALLGNYNAFNGTTHEEAPANVYTIVNPVASDTSGYVVTIPKGSNVGYLQVKINPRKFLGFDYALGFQITNVQPSGYLISSNFNTGIVAIGVKNDWDGIYDYKGFSLRAGDAQLTGNFSGKEMALVTAGATSLKFGSLALWGDGNSGIGIGVPVLSIDKSTGPPYPVTITSDGGAKNTPGYNSRYDPATKTFYLSFTWGAGPSARLSTDTLTYLRPR